MSWQRWLLALIVVMIGSAQYALAIYALRDLSRRPRVRGENKVIWALVILMLPIAGAVLYAAIGPTSFLPRTARMAPSAMVQLVRRFDHWRR